MPIKLRYTLHSMSFLTSTLLLNSLVVYYDTSSSPPKADDRLLRRTLILSVILFGLSLHLSRCIGRAVHQIFNQLYVFHIIFVYLIIIFENSIQFYISNKLASVCLLFSSAFRQRVRGGR